MRVDHVSYAAEHDGVHATAERLGKFLGVTPVDGGVHPRFGTRNVILPLAPHKLYVEVVESLDHPASDKAPFGQVVKARPATGGGWLGWVLRVKDIHEVEERLGREAAPGNRTRPDGVELRWKQIGVKGTQAAPQLPFFVELETSEDVHPGHGAENSGVTIEALTIAGDPDRVCDWLGLPVTETSTIIDFQFVAPRGTPGLLSVTFNTPDGKVTI